MKTALVALVFLSAISFQAQAYFYEEPLQQQFQEMEKWRPWWPHPHPHPGRGAVPPTARHPMPPFMEPKIEKCLEEFGAEKKTCYPDILKSFFTRKISMDDSCCNAIQKFNADCESTVFGHFHNPFFNLLLKCDCAGRTAAPSPSS